MSDPTRGPRRSSVSREVVFVALFLLGLVPPVVAYAVVSAGEADTCGDEDGSTGCSIIFPGLEGEIAALLTLAIEVVVILLLVTPWLVVRAVRQQRAHAGSAGA